MASNAKTESNKKIYQRNLPSRVIQPYLSTIPENIRYQDMNDHLQSLERREIFFNSCLSSAAIFNLLYRK
mgnify:CR=1 FL=1